LPPGVALPQVETATLFSYRLTSEGEVRDPALYKSSGNAELDNAAFACVRDLGHWAKITVDGKPAEITWVLGYYWRPLPQQSSFADPSPAGRANRCGFYYPPIAVRLGQQGNAVVKYRISPTGNVKDAAISESSGYAALDEATLACVASLRYFPAMQNGQAIEIDKSLAVHWRLGGPTGPMVQLNPQTGGRLLVEEEAFSDPDRLKAKLAEMNKRIPRPQLCVVRPDNFLNFVAALTLLNAAGMPQVATCVEPMSN
jgi:TonB family protein